MTTSATAILERRDALAAPLPTPVAAPRGLLIACGFAFTIGIAAGGAAYGFAPRSQAASVAVALVEPTRIAAPTPRAAPPLTLAATSDSTPKRIMGIAGDDLNASLLAAGVPQSARRSIPRCMRMNPSRG